MPSTEITDDLELLLPVLPVDVRTALDREEGAEDLIEILLDLGRRPEARFPTRSIFNTKESDLSILCYLRSFVLKSL